MSEITKNEDSRATPLPTPVWIALAALAVFIYFFGLNIPFLGPDEARYAQVAREMLERGDWITPTLGGFNWFEKPALLYWLQIASYNLFGVSEFSARFGSAVFGLGTIAGLWLLGRHSSVENTEGLSNARPRAAPDFANWLALIAASTIGILVFARGASFDIIITFPIAAALVSFFIFDQSKKNSFGSRYLPLGLFYVFTGLALLAKGLIGIVFPFAIVGLFYVLSRRRPSGTFLVSLVWGTLVAGAVASTWYLPMYRGNGYQFIDEFFIQHHFQRFTSNKYQHPQPFYFFFWVLPLMTLPWLPFFVAALIRVVKQLFRRVPASTRPGLSSSPLLLFSLAWLIVPLGFFSFSGSKLPGYVLPAMPGAIILTAIFIFDLVRSSNKWRNTVLTIATVTFAGTLLLLILVVPRFADTDSVRSLIDAAKDRGYVSNRVLTLEIISHNAEFYAAGRLLRDEHGKQRRLSTIGDVIAETRAENGRPVLVLLPIDYSLNLTREQSLQTEILKDNGEFAIAAVSLR